MPPGRRRGLAEEVYPDLKPPGYIAGKTQGQPHTLSLVNLLPLKRSSGSSCSTCCMQEARAKVPGGMALVERLFRVLPQRGSWYYGIAGAGRQGFAGQFAARR